MSTDKRNWLVGTFPQWIVTGLLAMSLTLAGMVWRQQNDRIVALEASQKEVAGEQMSRTRVLTELHGNDKAHDLAIVEIKLALKDLAVELRELNRLIRDRKLPL